MKFDFFFQHPDSFSWIYNFNISEFGLRIFVDIPASKKFNFNWKNYLFIQIVPADFSFIPEFQIKP